MIKINVNEDVIKVKGHAGYADYGNDIVCASVSSLITCTVNGILNINNESIMISDNNDEFVIKVLSNDDVTIKLINNLIMLLEELEREYPKNIKISKGE